jgi:exodeoxyribonuclease V beta subunit
LPAKYFGPIARLLWDALRTPVALGDGAPIPLARAARLAREMEILYAIAPEMGAIRTANERFVRGFIDVVFEHEGRIYFADWKTDVLDSYAPDALAAHVGASYAIQGLLYSLGLAKMLHATDVRAYERSFGGYAYCFVRGMNADRVPSEGTYFHRPSWEELREAEQALARGQLPPGDAAGKRGPA